MKTKARALRHKIWFKTLSRAERAIIDLTVKYIARVRSSTLAAIISSIVSKVLKILKNGFLEKVNRVGSAIAEKVCGIAKGWGNENALNWKHDSGFIRFLGVNAIATLGI